MRPRHLRAEYGAVGDGSGNACRLADGTAAGETGATCDINKVVSIVKRTLPSVDVRRRFGPSMNRGANLTRRRYDAPARGTGG